MVVERGEWGGVWVVVAPVSTNPRVHQTLRPSMSDSVAEPVDIRLFLSEVLSVVGRLPPELIIRILYYHRGLVAPSAIAWQTEPGHAARLRIHRKLVSHRAVGAAEGRCWCAGFSLSALLPELHAFGTPHQSAMSRMAARHTAPARPPDNFSAYRPRCAFASLLTRVATSDSPELARRVPGIQPRVGHDAEAPFLPVNHRLTAAAILPWFVRAGIQATDGQASVPDLVREYYAQD